MPIAAVLLSKNDVADVAASGAMLTTSAVVCWMKMVSYAHCGHACRADRRRGEKISGDKGYPGDNLDEEVGARPYPYNLTLANLGYYILAPTLTYQVVFPQSPKIRWRWLLRRFVEAAMIAAFTLFLIEQYIEPTIRNSMIPFDDMNWPKMLERLLKLSIPVLYVWLLGFYLVFHLTLNITAELLRFGDREFYRDWWNAKTLEDYWRLWNLPVHRWMVRTVYFPSLRFGMNRSTAVFTVFFVSAVFHELVVGVPLRMVRAWAFLGILLQVTQQQPTNQPQRQHSRDVNEPVVLTHPPTHTHTHHTPSDSSIDHSSPPRRPPPPRPPPRPPSRRPLLQVPMILVTKWMHARLRNKQLGNIMFWISFCFVGQPLSVLMYYHDFLLRHRGVGVGEVIGALGALAAEGKGIAEITTGSSSEVASSSSYWSSWSPVVTSFFASLPSKWGLGTGGGRTEL